MTGSPSIGIAQKRLIKTTDLNNLTQVLIFSGFILFKIREFVIEAYSYTL